jgi:hypothetical protein
VPDTPTTNVESHLVAHTTQGRTPSKLTDTRGRRPDIPLLRHALRGQRRQPPSGAAAPTYRRSLSSCDAARTNNPYPKLPRAISRRPRPSHQLIQGRRPDIKVRPPTLGRVDRADHTAAQAAQHCHPSHEESQPYLKGPPPAMVPEAAASKFNHHPEPLPRRPPSPTQEKPHATAIADSPRRRPQEGGDVGAIVARSG